MIVDRAGGVQAACTATWVHASLIDAGPIAGAFGALRALGPTVGRSTNVVSYTRTDGG